MDLANKDSERIAGGERKENKIRVGWGNPENVSLREGQKKKEFTKEHEKEKLERLVESQEGS